jgi:histidinol dehydrogenase
VGGAQGVGALAYGTETIRPVDVIAGPGNAYVQEAKRQLAGTVGLDGIAGPSELVVVASREIDPELVALDLLAQAEHGPDSLLCLITDDPQLLDSVVATACELADESESIESAHLSVVAVADLKQAVRLAEAIAPEHLELVGTTAEGFADQIRTAGCVFVGSLSATAFGDYVAGTNHVLPTAGAARFSSALSVHTFRRRMSRLTVSDEAARSLAEQGSLLAEAEGFPIHGESMRRRGDTQR